MSKVLIIDDDKMSLKMAEFIVKKGGHETITATSGQEGIEAIKSNNPDVVLLDIEMPGLSGFETLDMIRKDQTIKDVRVFFLTGTVDEQVQGKISELNADGYIEKPIVAQKLFEALK